MMQRSIMVEGDHEGDEEDYLFEHKHCKIREPLSHTSKAMTTNNLETLIP
jgi:hypothetical protein